MLVFSKKPIFMIFSMFLILSLSVFTVSCGLEEGADDEIEEIEETNGEDGNTLGDTDGEETPPGSDSDPSTIEKLFTSLDGIKKPTDGGILSKSDLLIELNGNSDFYVEGTSVSLAGSTFYECTDQLFIDSQTNTNENGWYSSVLDMNEKSCAQEFGEAAYDDLYVSTYIGCADTDFSSFDGYMSVVRSWYGSDFTCSNGEYFFQSNSEEYNTADDSAVTNGSSSNYVMDENFEPCNINFGSGGQKEFLEKCIEQFAVSVTSNDVYLGVFQHKMTYSEGLKFPAEDTNNQWFENGTIIYETYNWIVTITYTDAATAPTWTAVTVDESDTASGTLSF